MIFHFLNRLVAFLAALFLPLAAGALWSALSLRFSAELPAMALLCAAATWPARHYLSRHGGLVRALLSVLICALGIGYAQWLKSASVVAATIGVGFLDAMMLIGTDLALAIAQARGNLFSVVFVAISLALAFWFGWRGNHGDRRAIPNSATIRPQSAP